MRVLIVASRFPLPPWRGNQVRTVEWLRALAGDEIALVCPRPAPPELARQLTHDKAALWTHASGLGERAGAVVASLVDGQPIQEGLYAARSAHRALSRAVREHRPEVAIVQMVRCGWALEQLRREAPGLPVLFDAIDAMGLHFERAAHFAHPALRPLLRAEAGRCRRRERELASRAALSIAVSARDLDAIGARQGRVVPVSGRAVAARAGTSTEPRVLLSGNLGYRPTVHGALWFAEEVWPRVAASLPGARWVLAGARPAAAVRRLGRLPGVEVHGDVEDLDPFLASATVAIAPMASGSGVPMKVLEAWAAGLPVVAHPWTAAGLAADAQAALAVADGAEEWHRAVTELLLDSQAAAKLAERGREAWHRSYHPERVDEALRAAIGACRA
jgi:glycosyltransferase involved in cell wall biosynthesis